ncbi:hypothetical protein AAMO2058_000584200 [Amorphochlora amoebiformis]
MLVVPIILVTLGVCINGLHLPYNKAIDSQKTTKFNASAGFRHVTAGIAHVSGSMRHLSGEPESESRVALLITTFNDADTRNSLYVPRIQWWLENTQFSLYIVDSGNHKFSGLKLKHLTKRPKPHFLHFDQAKLTTHEQKVLSSHGDSEAKSVYELISIQRVGQRYGSELKKFDYIIKLTGKYVLPTLSQSLDHVFQQFTKGDLPDMLVESMSFPVPGDCLNSEIFGFRGAIFDKVVGILEERLEKGGIMENAVKMVQMHENMTSFTLPEINIPQQWRTNRGDGSTLAHVHRCRSS